MRCNECKLSRNGVYFGQLQAFFKSRSFEISMLPIKCYMSSFWPLVKDNQFFFKDTFFNNLDIFHFLILVDFLSPTTLFFPKFFLVFQTSTFSPECHLLALTRSSKSLDSLFYPAKTEQTLVCGFFKNLCCYIGKCINGSGTKQPILNGTKQPIFKIGQNSRF